MKYFIMTLCILSFTRVSFAQQILLPKGVSPHTMFRCSFKDRNGNLWFGTSGAGVYRYDEKSFTHYAEQDGLTSPAISAIAEDQKGVIWFATDDGVFYYNGRRFIRLQMPLQYNIRKIPVLCIIGDKKGNVWFGTDNQGLWRYDGVHLLNFPKEGFVSALLSDSKGNIWIAASKENLGYYDGQTFHSLNFSAHILQMITDRSGQIWIATRLDGICRVKDLTVQRFTSADGVLDDMASSLYEAPDGKIWFGSLGKAGSAGGGVRGLGVYDGKTFKHISSKAMTNDQVWSIIGDRYGHLWIGTKEFGLYEYDGKRFKSYTSSQY